MGSTLGKGLVAVSLFYGIGVQRNKVTGYQKACEVKQLGSAFVTEELAQCLLEGIGESKDELVANKKSEEEVSSQYKDKEIVMLKNELLKKDGIIEKLKQQVAKLESDKNESSQCLATVTTSVPGEVVPSSTSVSCML